MLSGETRKYDHSDGKTYDLVSCLKSYAFDIHYIVFYFVIVDYDHEKDGEHASDANVVVRVCRRNPYQKLLVWCPLFLLILLPRL